MTTCGLAIYSAWLKATGGNIMNSGYCPDISCRDCFERHDSGQELHYDNLILIDMLVTDPLQRAVIEVHE